MPIILSTLENSDLSLLSLRMFQDGFCCYWCFLTRVFQYYRIKLNANPELDMSLIGSFDLRVQGGISY